MLLTAVEEEEAGTGFILPPPTPPPPVLLLVDAAVPGLLNDAVELRLPGVIGNPALGRETAGEGGGAIRRPFGRCLATGEGGITVCEEEEEEEEEISMELRFCFLGGEETTERLERAVCGLTFKRLKSDVSVLNSQQSLKHSVLFRPPNTTMEFDNKAAVWKERGDGRRFGERTCRGMDAGSTVAGELSELLGDSLIEEEEEEEEGDDVEEEDVKGECSALFFDEGATSIRHLHR